MKLGILNTGFLLAASLIVTCCTFANSFDYENDDSSRNELFVSMLPIPKSTVASQVSLELANSISQRQDADVKDETAKKTTETWQQYVDRLQTAGHISNAEKDRWEQGNSITVQKALTVTQITPETRTRTVDVTKFRTIEEDGKTVRVPYVETVQQNYTVQIPKQVTKQATLSLPKPGSRPEDAKHPGFQLEDAPAVSRVTRANQPIISRARQVDSGKKADETWKQYVDRLLKNKIISESQRDDWASGKSIEVEKTFDHQTITQEVRTRNITVMRKETSVDEEDNETERNVPQTIPQQYTVAVPKISKLKGTLRIPKMGTHPEDHATRGFMTDDDRPVQTVIGATNVPRIGRPQMAAAQMRGGQNNVPARIETSRTSKPSSETWQRYLDRLVEQKSITRAQYRKWMDGEALEVRGNYKKVEVQAEMRTRTEMRSKMIIEKDDDGSEREVQKTVPEEVTYTVMVPVQQDFEVILKIPAKGTTEDDTENKGFLTADGNVVQQIRPVAPRPIRAVNVIRGGNLDKQTEDLTQKSNKKETESWDDYVLRLHTAKIISDIELDDWMNGKALKIEKSIDGHRLQLEERTRMVRVNRVVNEKDKDGNTVQKTIAENVEQKYTVNIPVPTTWEGMFKIPKRGSKPDNATNKGFISRTKSSEVPRGGTLRRRR